MKVNLIQIVCACALVLSSCNEEEVLENVSLKSNSQEMEVSNISLENDSIIQLKKEDFPDVKKVAKLSNDNISEMIDQLVGVKVQIQATNYVGNNNTLEFIGAGKELKLASFSKSKPSQSFYLKVLPATSGIPYMIYTWEDSNSKIGNFPIGVGSYSSTPQNYVVYAKDSNTGSMFGFGWDFMSSNSKNGFVIENQDIVGQGSGGWMDIFYYSMNAYNGMLSMAKTSKGTYQEFTFIPDYNFKATKLEFFYDEAQISNADDIVLRTSNIANNGNSPMTKTFVVEEIKTENSTFTEAKGVSITNSSSANFSIGIPKVITFGIGGSTTVQSGESQTFTYQNSLNVQRKFTDQLAYEIPPHSRTICQYIGTKCTLDVPYKVTCKAEGNTNLSISIRGVWKGVDYYNEQIKKDDFLLSNPNVVVRSEIIHMNSKTK